MKLAAGNSRWVEFSRIERVYTLSFSLPTVWQSHMLNGRLRNSGNGLLHRMLLPKYASSRVGDVLSSAVIPRFEHANFAISQY